MLWSDPFGYWPFGFLLSALPDAAGARLAGGLAAPLPFSDGEPSRVEQYGPPGHLPLAPPEFWSALLFGCGLFGSPCVLALPLEWSEFPGPLESDDALEPFALPEFPGPSAAWPGALAEFPGESAPWEVVPLVVPVVSAWPYALPLLPLS